MSREVRPKEGGELNISTGKTSRFWVRVHSKGRDCRNRRTDLGMALAKPSSRCQNRGYLRILCEVLLDGHFMKVNGFSNP